MSTARRHHPREPSQTGIGPLRLRQEATAHARPLDTHPVLAHGQRQIAGKALAHIGFIGEAHHAMATIIAIRRDGTGRPASQDAQPVCHMGRQGQGSEGQEQAGENRVCHTPIVL
jgi:hypothetical protein